MKGTLNLQTPLASLRGAEYNPREIDDQSIGQLRDSIARLGMVKPLIVRGKTLVAGHQRTKALRLMGATHAPAFHLGQNATTYDEVRFNQLHNATDLDFGDENARVVGGFRELGWQAVKASSLAGNWRGKGAAIRTTIAELIGKFGPWGACVATQSGEIIHAAQYALACALKGEEILLHVVPDSDGEAYREALGTQYGTFSYRHIPRNTWVQSMAQLHRLRTGANRSWLWEDWLMPHLAAHRELRVLDFGSGQGDYAARARRLGFRVLDMEFYRRVGGSKVIDVTAVNRMVDALLAEFEANGPFDVVICDSVLNSVDSLETERCLMDMLNALLKQDGLLYASGRCQTEVTRRAKETSATGDKMRLAFMDGAGLTGLFRDGSWFFQRYHSEDQISALFRDHGFKIVNPPSRKPGVKDRDTWQRCAQKTHTVEIERIRAAIACEFDLPLSPHRRLGRHLDAERRIVKHWQ